VKFGRRAISEIVGYLFDQKQNKILPASQTVATGWIAPEICQASPQQTTQSARDFIKIGSLSAKL